MKKIIVLAAIALMLLPVSAMAGMTAFMDMDELSDIEMAETTGQAGITINLTQQINGGYISWGDNDGCNSTTLGNVQGWLTLDGISTSAITVNGLTIDVCSMATNTWLTIGVPNQVVSARINNIRLGSTPGTSHGATNILGHLVIRNLNMVAMNVQIRGH